MTLPAVPALALAVPGATLRAWREADAPALALHANDAAVWRHMAEGFPHPYTPAQALHWVGEGQREFGGDNWALCIDDAAVGGCGVHVGQGGQRCNAEIGYWIGRAHWGRGLGTAVVQALAARALADREVMRVFAAVHAYNAASLRVLEKNGFEPEGLLRLAAVKAGMVIDLVLMARHRPGVVGGVPTLAT